MHYITRLLLIIAIAIIPAVSMAESNIFTSESNASAATEPDIEPCASDTLKLIFIGNSFAGDVCESYLRGL